MKLVKETDDDPYHGPKLRHNMQNWAESGRYILTAKYLAMLNTHTFCARMRAGMTRNPNRDFGLRVALD